jgi:hypothetical protein
VLGAEGLDTAQLLSDPFLTPQVVTQRMYRDLVTGAAKAHLPEATGLKFPEGYFQRLQTFQATFGLTFKSNEMLLRALTHKSYAIQWLYPHESKQEGTFAR